MAWIGVRKDKKTQYEHYFYKVIHMKNMLENNEVLLA